MRRAERLFQLVQLIRGRRLSTARFLAERLEVSERTVYRDVADLIEAHTSFCAWWATVDPQGNRIAFCCPAMKPDDGDINVGQAETIVNLPLTASGHDPAKDSSSLATAIPYQFGIFYVPAV